MIRNETTIGGIQVVSEKFNSIHDFLNEYENKPVSQTYASHDTANSLQNETYDSHDKHFTGVSGYPEAVNQLKNGVNVKAIKSARVAASTGTKKTVKHSVYGGRVCVPAYLSGSPTCMRRSVKMPAKTELNVVVDAGVPCYVTADQITDAGKIIVKFVTELEQRYNVNIHAISSTSFNRKANGDFKDAYIFGIKIKDAGKPFSAARVSFCLTSAAFLRVFSFLWRTRAEGIPYCYGLGTSTSNNMPQEEKVVGSVYKNAVLVSTLNVIKNGEAALPKVK